jgi:glycosyltransferase involved in cell wall biosynthesis
MPDHPTLMPTSSPQVSVLVPAYNEEAIIDDIIQRVSHTLTDSSYSFEIIVIDDGSTDQTAIRAEQVGAKVIRHPYNIGNGASIKTGIRAALGDIIVMMDADGQHPPEDILRLLEVVGPYDLVVGARTKGSDSTIHRDIANHAYNLLASYVSGRRILDLTSGFRAINASVARGFVYLLPNKFSYPTTLTLATLRTGRSVAYVPIVSPKRVGKSKIRLLSDGVRFFLIILRIATFYSPLKIFIPISLLMFLTGFGYGLYKVLALGLPYGPTSAMLMTVAVVVFMVGLVAEQVAQLRFEWSERFERDG